jgi:hypothetical protein
MTNYLETKWMLNVNGEGLPIVRMKPAVAPGFWPRYLKECDEVRNLSSGVDTPA